jgi:PTS system nitrogen regulatory IIA component
MHLYSDGELTTLEGNPEEAGLLVSAHLPEACVALPMNARSKRSALEELVSAAERSWHVYDPDAILTALIQREESHATALENGVAIPHPRRSPTGALGDTVIAFGRSFAGIPFGGTRGRLTDLFFLVCSKDDHTHLKILARLSRMMLRPNFLEQLRLADSPDEAYQTILATEREVARG